MKNKIVIGLASLLFAAGLNAQTASVALPAGAPAVLTNSLDFTNVSFEVSSAPMIHANGATLAGLMATWDWHKATPFDVGSGGLVELSATGSGFHQAIAYPVELIKNLGNFQLVGKLGGGGTLEGTRAGCIEVGDEINYNLVKGFNVSGLSISSMFSYVTVGFRLDEYAGSSWTQDRVAYIGVGGAF